MIWTMILTFSLGVEGGVAMLSVRMADQASCMSAANLWLNATNDGEGSHRWHLRRSAICVPSL